VSISEWFLLCYIYSAVSLLYQYQKDVGEGWRDYAHEVMTAKPHRTETDGNSISRERIFILETHAAVLLLLLLLLLLWIDLYVVLLFFFSSSGGAHVEELSTAAAT
jgi:Flp pilus assembly protein TadB